MSDSDNEFDIENMDEDVFNAFMERGREIIYGGEVEEEEEEEEEKEEEEEEEEEEESDGSEYLPDLEEEEEFIVTQFENFAYSGRQWLAPELRPCLIADIIDSTNLSREASNIVADYLVY
jgi:hypothetical protein